MVTNGSFTNTCVPMCKLADGYNYLTLDEAYTSIADIVYFSPEWQSEFEERECSKKSKCTALVKSITSAADTP